MRLNSINEWKKYCFNNHKIYLKNKYFMGWLRQKKVDIFNCSELKNEEIMLIKNTIRRALSFFGKGKIRLSKTANLDFAIKNGKIDGTQILDMAKKSGNRRSASIFLINKRVKTGKDILEFGDALTYVSDGVTIFTFDPKVKYPKRFFKDEVAHEVYHLLGLNVHHPDTKVMGYGKLPRCIMEYNAPSEKLCRKCKDGLSSFLEGIKNATN
ncbi:hypothetical protein HYX07_03965 [Candidatus Woesearchaeota archaeon]|nr:hypothetical protein [Candidatus Woesearchaeota archaeon]